MPKFLYNGKTIEGQIVSGEASAKDAASLELHLVNRGIFLESSRPTFGYLQLWFVRLFKKTEITNLTRQLHILIKSKLSILESLELAHEQLKDAVLKQVLSQIMQDVESGTSLVSAFGQYPGIFDELYISLIEAGEQSGNLEFSFDRIADYREKAESTAKKIKSAMAYPLLVVVVAVLVMIALVLYVVPVFASMYENFNAELPALTRRIVGVSDLLRNNLSFLLIGIVTLMILSGVSLSTTKVKLFLHRAVLSTPLFGKLTTKVITARFCRTMGTLLTSGVDIVYALRIASRTTGNMYATKVTSSAENNLIAGKSLTESLDALNLFPKAMLRLTASGEKTGQLGEMLSRAADYYERETDSEISTLTTLVEPVIIIVMGVVVAFILVAMYLPLFDLVGTL